MKTMNDKTVTPITPSLRKNEDFAERTTEVSIEGIGTRKQGFFNTWVELSQTIDDARGLVLLADYQCFDSISDEEERQNAAQALISASRVLMNKAAGLLLELEPACK